MELLDILGMIMSFRKICFLDSIVIYFVTLNFLVCPFLSCLHTQVASYSIFCSFFQNKIAERSARNAGLPPSAEEPRPPPRSPLARPARGMDFTQYQDSDDLAEVHLGCTSCKLAEKLADLLSALFRWPRARKRWEDEGEQGGEEKHKTMHTFPSF